MQSAIKSVKRIKLQGAFSLGAPELEMSRIKQTSFMRLAMFTHIPRDLYSRNEGRWANAKDVGRRRWGNCWSKQALDSGGGACCAQKAQSKRYAEGLWSGSSMEERWYAVLFKQKDFRSLTYLLRNTFSQCNLHFFVSFYSLKQAS